MFTGIVARTGQVIEQIEKEQASSLVLDAGALADEVGIGESVAVNGTCLTAVACDAGKLRFDILRETLERTSLGEVGVGDVVNLELALRPTDRMGGHFVTGHVDGTGTVSRLEAEPGQTILEVDCDQNLTDQMILKGSVCLDGVSLTLTDVQPGRCQVALIPHTLEITNLGRKQVGDRINVETDMLGKYVLRFLEGLDLGRPG